MYSDDDENDYYEYDADDYSFSDDADISISPHKEKRFSIVPAADIITEMNKYIDKVNEIFKMKRSLIRRLLVHFKWNPERLIDRYYETQDNCEELFKEAGLVYIPNTNKRDRQESRATTVGTCLVCFNSNLELMGMPCQHYYCKQCWSQYIQTMIMDNGVTENICCMDTYCNTSLGESFVVAAILNEDVKTRYKQLIASSYISTNKLFKWCPRAGCGNSAQVTSLDVKYILCTCGMEWCFECGEPDHKPLENCEYLKKWEKKSIDQSETNKWLVLNTKECPKCKAFIEKNGGCNHMTCNNLNCSYEFCWMCLGDWAPHGTEWFSCNTYVENSERNAQLSKERKAMERYHHYYDRYVTHRKSSELEEVGLALHIQSKADYIQNKLDMPWIEAQFLEEALVVLLKCRKMLQYSYVLAYYLDTSPLHAIFEENQKDLEHNTELLSGLLEDHRLPKTQPDLMENKMQVNNRASYCEARRSVLLKDSHTSYEKGSWTFRLTDN